MQTYSPTPPGARCLCNCALLLKVTCDASKLQNCRFGWRSASVRYLALDGLDKWRQFADVQMIPVGYRPLSCEVCQWCTYLYDSMTSVWRCNSGHWTRRPSRRVSGCTEHATLWIVEDAIRVNIKAKRKHLQGSFWRWLWRDRQIVRGRPSGLVRSGFPTKTLYAAFLSPVHAACLARFILDLFTQETFREEYRMQGSLLGTCPLFLTPS
jgi:hypothetical protein